MKINWDSTRESQSNFVLCYLFSKTLEYFFDFRAVVWKLTTLDAVYMKHCD